MENHPNSEQIKKGRLFMSRPLLTYEKHRD